MTKEEFISKVDAVLEPNEVLNVTKQILYNKNHIDYYTAWRLEGDYEFCYKYLMENRDLLSEEQFSEEVLELYSKREELATINFGDLIKKEDKNPRLKAELNISHKKIVELIKKLKLKVEGIERVCVQISEEVGLNCYALSKEFNVKFDNTPGEPGKTAFKDSESNMIFSLSQSNLLYSFLSQERFQNLTKKERVELNDLGYITIKKGVKRDDYYSKHLFGMCMTGFFLNEYSVIKLDDCEDFLVDKEEIELMLMSNAINKKKLERFGLM